MAAPVVTVTSEVGQRRVILIVTAIVFSSMVAYTILTYWIFRGKAQDLSYD